ncbi:hypothetical protein HPB52_003149 [Rhipicephalus sanguineus]|uniref:Uncharacterized protein n=1 Tax=Rhipicephalus sanguineus TaxID=34632 RepID=A0A9D4PFM2_RHISA|nr:hypothetical protein HPB52_003149 [Rhipicephalus sanguineus]
MLKSLMGSMRKILGGLNTPSAKAVVQLLEVLEPLVVVLEALPPVPLREYRARDRVRGRAKRRHRVQAGTLRVRPTSTHEPRASTVERVPWAQSSGINGRGVDVRDFTRADEAPSYGIDRWSTQDAFDSATPSAPTTNCTPLVDYFS